MQPDWDCFRLALIGHFHLDDPLRGLTTRAYIKEHAVIGVYSYNSRSGKEKPKFALFKNIDACRIDADPLQYDDEPIID
jgi:hypothetical protein